MTAETDRNTITHFHIHRDCNYTQLFISYTLTKTNAVYESSARNATFMNIKIRLERCLFDCMVILEDIVCDAF